MLLTIVETGVPIVAFLLMVAVGLDVTREDLGRVAGRAWTIAGLTIAQVACLPAAAWLLAPFVPTQRIGGFLLLVAACPGGGMSNVYVYLARANTALSVTLTAVSCLAAIVTMPAVFAAYTMAGGRPVEFAVPLPALLAQLLVMAVIPVSAGAWIRHRYPQLERKHGKRFRALSAAGVTLIVGIGLLQGGAMLTKDLAVGGAAATLLAAAGMIAGWLLAVLLRMPRSDRFTLVAEFAVRNLAIAMVIEVTLLHHAEFIAFGGLALLGQALLLGGAVSWKRRVTAE
jgi:BASS family bile acid:Na+ symporter